MADTVGAARLDITATADGVEAGVGKAKKSLATLGGAAKAAGKEASEGVDKIGTGAEGASQKLDRATKQMIASIQRTTATLESGSRSSSKFFETLAQQRGVDVNALKPYLDQLDATSRKQVAAAAAAKLTAPAITQVGMSARATAAAMRGVPAQFTDIVTALSSGQAPLTVFLQQGGQLKDMFGGIGPAARALGGYIGGLLNPLTLAAAAVAALGLAYFQGSKEAENYSRAIILSGNAAGVTVGQLQQMAERISAVTGTQSAAAEALATFVQNGTLAGDSIERFVAIALRMERDTGQSVAETAKQFAALGREPVSAAAKLNEATNFLTASLAHQIKILEDQGRVSEAAALAQKAYADALETRLPQIEQQLGSLERAWRSVAGAAKGAWDFMLGVGRDQTAADKLALLQRDLTERQQRNQRLGIGDTNGDTAVTRDLQEQIRLLKASESARAGAARAQADQADQAKARLDFDKAGDQFLTKRARMEQEITRAREMGAKAGASQAEIDKRIGDIREKYADKGAARASSRLARADVNLDVERIRGEGEKLVAVYTGAERRIETLRQAGLLSDREYFDSKRAFINLESQAKEDALTQEIARLQKEKLSGADKLQNDKKIADAEAKLAILRADTSSKLEELSDRQVQAIRKEAAEYEGAKRAAEDYFQSTLRRQDQDISGLGKGNRQREIDRGAFDINERFGAQRQALDTRRAQQELMGTFTEDQRREYDQRLALINEYQARELQSWQEHNRRKIASEQDWSVGAQEALRNYADEAENVSKQSEEFFGRTFSSMEDALVQFAETGKISFSGLIRSILVDLARLQAKQAAGGIARILAGAIGSYFGGTVNTGSVSGADMDVFTSGQSATYGRAIGGPVSAGGTYQVNERGTPELLNVGGKQFLMMGNQSGTVSPGGGEISIVNNLPVPIGKVDERKGPNGERVLIIQQAVEAMAAALNDPNSRPSQSMRRNYSVTRNR